jgi:hypothetical protein
VQCLGSDISQSHSESTHPRIAVELAPERALTQAARPGGGAQHARRRLRADAADDHHAPRRRARGQGPAVRCTLTWLTALSAAARPLPPARLLTSVPLAGRVDAGRERALRLDEHRCDLLAPDEGPVPLRAQRHQGRQPDLAARARHRGHRDGGPAADHQDRRRADLRRPRCAPSLPPGSPPPPLFHRAPHTASTRFSSPVAFCG